MLNIDELANEINKALAVTDKDGQPIKTTDEMKTYAKAVINTLKAASVINAPGTITAMTAAGSPITAGTGIGGTIMNMNAGLWASITTNGFALSNPAMLLEESVKSTVYISSTSLVGFISGSITGTSTATSEAPGVLLNGAGSDGKVSGINGVGWAAAVLVPLGDPLVAKKVYDAISNYIISKASVSYISGTITGVCPMSAGPLSGGTGINGTIE